MVKLKTANHIQENNEMFLRRAQSLTMILVLLLATGIVGCSGDSASPTTSSPATTDPPVTTTDPPPTTAPPTTTPPPTTAPPATTTPAGLTSAILNASAAINSYEFIATSTTVTTVSGYTVTATSVTDGQIDLNAQKAHINTVVNTQGYEIQVENYIADNWTYIKYVADATPPGFNSGTWYKVSMTATEWQDSWNSNSQSGQNNALFNNATVTIIGSETINGIDCYKINLIPDKASFLAYLQAQGTTDGADDVTNIEQSLQDIQFTGWVAKINSYMIKTEMSLAMTIEGVTANIQSVSTISNINQALNITLPAAAQAATQIS
ncbi:lipoprotein [Dehalogenimonas sp. WBC-2]|nr:lipoprotein [Dehalogenimonas sp. WBC-2]